MIDLRSDTVTKPSPAMREAMARAEVGDDVYGEDPTVNLLQNEVAALLGKEAALFVPSGTMANQIGIWAHTRPGDEVLVSQGAHCMIFESGAGAALSGVQFRTVGNPNGMVTAAEVDAAIHPDNPHYPPTQLVALENTHNRGGGRIAPQREIEAIAEVTRRRGIALHLDGARLWNVHAATKTPLPILTKPFDTVSVCLSKGLGAPVGSMLAGPRALISRAVRRRKMLGGGMRQAGVLAAAGRHAIAHNLSRLEGDHVNARSFATNIAQATGVELELGSVETNIVIWELATSVPFDAATFVARAKEKGLLLNAMGARKLRVVTHFDVSAADCKRAAEIAVAILNAA